ncbi:MAG: hypothetical protein A2X93_07920 [Deltaproteobacteria bacterium GWC2_56_8]|nr:MAG: hypothetical protein A2X93_07920 [Deltaproteobacteria bacterium GWC2_56_8]
MRITRILGLDPSYTETGYAVINFTDLKVIEAGSIRTKPTSTEWERLSAIHDALRSIVLAHELSFAAIETPFVGKNPLTAIKLASVRGIGLFACHSAGIPIALYAPAQVKATLTGRPHADKGAVAGIARGITGFTTANHNISDAIAIAICGALKWKEGQLLHA